VLVVSMLATLVAFTGGAAAAELPQLHAGEDQIRDSHNRQVLLRGVNVTALTDQFQVDPDLPPVTPLRDRDYRKMNDLGFNVIRLAITWSKLEPERGRINRHYIERIRKVVDKAADHGIYTIIDMHNGGWGKYVATPPGEKCPGKRLKKSHGWLGAPEWATFTDGESTCHHDDIKKRTPAVKAAWDNFWHNHSEPGWADGHGIQDHLVGVWGVLARAFADDTAVAGYDVLNEPDPGSTEREQQAFVSRFYADSIAAIRRSEAQAGGFSHLVLFEPNLTWSQNGLPSHSPAPGFSDDPNLVFAPHLYGRDVHSTDTSLKLVRRYLRQEERRVAKRAHSYGVPLWVGEWGFSIFDEQALRKLQIQIEIQDSHGVGSAFWQWKVACGSPQTFDTLKPKPLTRVVGNLNPVECPSGKAEPRAKGWNAIIGRAYPRAAPGTLTELSAHGSRVSLEAESACDDALRLVDPRACRLEVWIPKKKHDPGARPQVKGRHLQNILVRRATGGWLATADVTGGYSLTAD
jgi:endoglycosylceramidase